MKKTLFDHSDYKSYLLEWLGSESSGGRGSKARLAVACGCHPTYVSQVLNGSSHFSPEQGCSLNAFLGHSEAEADYFVLLLSKGRAGSQALRNFFTRKIEQTLDHRRNLKTRLQHAEPLNERDHSIFFSSWHFAAIQVLCSVPEYQTQAALTRRLNLTPARVATVLEFLTRVGGVIREGKKFKSGTFTLHLGADSPLITRHHLNWRNCSIQNIERQEVRPEDLHYASAVAISRADALLIREILVKAVESVRARVKESPGEDLYCYIVDFFKVGEPSVNGVT